MNSKPNLEELEMIIVPSSVVFQNGQLLVFGDANKPNVAVVDPIVTGAAILTRLRLNGTEQTFQGVQQITIVGGNKADDFSNNTSIPSTILGGNGDDTIFGGAGNDTIDAGNGNDIVYDLLGTNVINSVDNQADRVYTNAASSANVDANDQLVSFFAAGRTPGSGVISLEQGILYITPTNNGSSVSITEFQGKVVVTYDFNDGQGPRLAIYAKSNIKAIAYFGGTGDDTFINNTTIEEAAYGSAGNDIIVSGTGAFNLLKGSGGNDVLVARGKKADLSGNGGTDLLFGSPGKTTFRTDALDLIFNNGMNDLIVAS